MAHPVICFQILSREPDETARFYTELFGWRVNADNPLGYRIINTNSEAGIQGGIWPAPEQANNFVQIFVQTDDVAESVRKAEGLGGRQVIPPTALPEGDEMAVMMDPRGMTFALWKVRG